MRQPDHAVCDQAGDVIVSTERLVLRSWREDDRPAFAAMFNTPAMTRHLGGPLPDAGVDILFDRRLADQAADGLSYWAVMLRESREIVGSAGLRIAGNYPGTPVQGMMEAGWRVAEGWQRRGIAAEAMRAAIAWCWSHRRVPQIASWTRPDNTPSLRLMRRLGFMARPEFDFIRPGSGEPCLVHVLERPREA